MLKYIKVKMSCEHTIQQEVRTKRMPRFLDEQTKVTLEQALEMPLSMSHLPFDIDTLSPTPLDPYALTVYGGVDYALAARSYMIDKLHSNTISIGDTHRVLIERAEQEILDQHFHRMQKNDEALRQWKEVAAVRSSDKVLSHRDAEGVMQVRAGVAQPEAILQLLARNPSMGGIEVSKATRPFCFTAYGIAKKVLHDRLLKLEERVNGFSATHDMSPTPYRSSIDQKNASLVVKSQIGQASLLGVELELINRESSVMYHPSEMDSVPENRSFNFGPHVVESSVIDSTTYVRVKS